MNGAISACLLFFVLSSVVRAELLVYPYRATLNAEINSVEIKITNSGSTTENYRLSLIQREIVNGDWQNVDTIPAHSANDIIKYSPKSATLEPGETQTVRIFAKSIRKVGSSELRSHLLIKQQPTTGNSPQVSSDATGGSVQLLYGVSIPVLVRGNDTGTTAQIDASSRGGLLNATVARNGPHSLHGSLSVNDSQGKLIGRLPDISVHVPYRSERFTIDIINPNAPKPWTIQYTDLDGRDISARVQIP